MAIIEWEYCSERVPNSYARLFRRDALPQEQSLFFHSSPYYQIVWICSGSGVYNVMGRLFSFKRGDVFLFAEHESHYVSHIEPGCGLSMSSVIFSRQFLCQENDSGLYSDYFRIYTDRGPQYSNALSGSDPRTALYCGVFEQMMKDCRLGGEEAAQLLRARLLLMLAQMSRDYAGMLCGRRAYDVYTVEKVRRAMIFMDEHFREDITLDEIARDAGMARTYFSSSFKREKGITPWDYLTSRRIMNAISLLVNEECNVTEAALGSGFNNTANFNRAFRKYTGKTPTEYLKTVVLSRGKQMKEEK